MNDSDSNAKNSATISYITLAITDFFMMKSFYDALGFVVYKQSNSDDHPYVMYQCGSVILALYPKALLAKQAGCDVDDKAINSAMSLSLNVEKKEDVDRMLLEAKALNTTVTREGFEPAWGGYCGYFKDPEENLWEIVWNPRFVF